MIMTIQDWRSPVGIGYKLERAVSNCTGTRTIEEKRLVFGTDIARRPEEATPELPYAGDVLQAVINEHNITNKPNPVGRFEDILSGLEIPEHRLQPAKGQAVWFPVENGIEVTDPWSTAADPATGYVKSVGDDGMIEVDVRKIYKRKYDPNIADEERAMTDVKGILHVDARYCFENRQDCMDYIIAQGMQGDLDPLFRASLDGLNKPAESKEGNFIMAGGHKFTEIPDEENPYLHHFQLEGTDIAFDAPVPRPCTLTEEGKKSLFWAPEYTASKTLGIISPEDREGFILISMDERGESGVSVPASDVVPGVDPSAKDVLREGLRYAQQMTSGELKEDIMERIRRMDEANDAAYDLYTKEGREAACSEYARLRQNMLSSSAEKKMEYLDGLAADMGLSFHMTNEAAYNQPHALVEPRYELGTMERDPFTEAVNSISEGNGLER